MSKKFLSGINITGTATLNTVANAGLDTDKFLVLDATGNIDYRTGDELKSDIGADRVSRVEHEVKLGESMTLGTPVYVPIAQDSGTNMTVLKASNASESTSSKTMGLIASSGITNDLVQVVTEGLLEGMNTGSASKGDPVWLGVDGALIFGLANKPSAPAHLVFIGIVTRAQTNNGEIFVKVQNGFEMGELHNYAEGSVQDNEVIVYESATSLYKPKSIPTILGYTPVSQARTLTINGTTYDLSADRSWTISANVNAREETEFTTDGTTATYSATYTVGQVDVFYNGSKLASTEFTATNGTSVTLGFTPPSGQIVEVVAWETGGGIGGTGTTNYIPKWTGSGTLGNSIIYDNGTTVSIGTTTSTLKFNVNGDVYASGGFFASNSLSFIGSLNNTSGISVNGTTGNTSFRAGGSDIITATNAGNVGIGTNSPTHLLSLYSSTQVDIKFQNAGATRAYIWANSGELAFNSLTSNPIKFFIDDVERVRITGGETRLGNGSYSPYLKFNSGGSTNYAGVINMDSKSDYLTISGGNSTGYSSGGGITFIGNDRYGTNTAGMVNIFAGNASGNTSYGYIAFETANTERARFNFSGHFLIGQTSASGNANGIYFRPGIESGFIVTNDIALQLSRLGSTGDIQSFYSGSTRVGTISVSGSNTSYNTSSDYRLKEDLKEFSGIDIVSKIKTYDFKWKLDGTRNHGVIAHEVAEVMPYIVMGEKDGKHYQGVDYSKIVPVLVKAIQEQQSQIEELKARLN